MSSEAGITQSQFNVLRAAIDFAYVDGHLDASERDALDYYLDNPRLSNKQRRILKEDIESDSVDLNSLLATIQSPRERAHLIMLANVVIHRDGTIHPAEQAAFDELMQQHYQQVDIESAKKSAHSTIAAFEAEEKKREAEEKASRPWYVKLLDAALFSS